MNLPFKKTHKARYEFRCFGQDFKQAHYRMARLSEVVPEELWKRTSHEIYIISSTTNISNTKIRDGKLEVKTLLKTLEGMEQWDPVLNEEFPIQPRLGVKKMFQVLNVKPPLLETKDMTQKALLQIIKNYPYLQLVRVKKERQGYKVNHTLCEYADVWINGARLSTLSCESTDIKDIKKALSDIGLQGAENINYVQAIKRVTGLDDQPFPHELFNVI